MTTRAFGIENILKTIRTVLIVSVFAGLSTGFWASVGAGFGSGAMAQGSGGKLMADGEKSLGSGQNDAAIDQLSKAIKSGSLDKPDMAKAFILRGQALQGKGSQARAVADFTNALWLESLSGTDTARAFALRGASRQKLGQGKSAAEDFRKAEAAQPGISQQFGGTPGNAASRSGGTTSRRSASNSDDEGFFSSLFGGSSEPQPARAPEARPRTIASGTGKVVRTTPRQTEPARRQTSPLSSDGIFGGLFGGESQNESKPETAGPRRLVATRPDAGSRTRLTPTAVTGNQGAVTRPGVLSDILPDGSAATVPQRKPGTQAPLLASPAPQRDVRSAAVKTDEPGFFERVFSGGDSNSTVQLNPPTTRARTQGPQRLVARSDGPPATPAGTVARAKPQTQRDTSLPTFVNQPRLTDRILANDAVETAGNSRSPTRIAGLQASQDGVRSPSRRVDIPINTVEPAQLDWNQTTRVERGVVAAPLVVARPRPARPAPVVRRPAAATRKIQPVQSAQRSATAQTRQTNTLRRQTGQPQTIQRQGGQTPPTFGSTVRTVGQAAGATVRSAVDWVGGAFDSSGSAQTPPAKPQRVAAAAVRQPASAKYTAPAKPVPRKRAESGGGGYVVQLAARQRRSDAEAAARKVRSQHGAVFAGAKPFIVRAEVPGKGTYYRVRVGPYRTQAQVASICAQLKGRGQDCFTTR